MRLWVVKMAVVCPGCGRRLKRTDVALVYDIDVIPKDGKAFQILRAKSAVCVICGRVLRRIEYAESCSSAEISKEVV